MGDEKKSGARLGYDLPGIPLDNSLDGLSSSKEQHRLRVVELAHGGTEEVSRYVEPPRGVDQGDRVIYSKDLL